MAELSIKNKKGIRHKKITNLNGGKRYENGVPYRQNCSTWRKAQYDQLPCPFH